LGRSLPASDVEHEFLLRGKSDDLRRRVRCAERSVRLCVPILQGGVLAFLQFLSLGETLAQWPSAFGGRANAGHFAKQTMIVSTPSRTPGGLQ
jgi:hypothetical protein